MTMQPRDAGNRPIPLLGYRHGSGQRLTVSTSHDTGSALFDERTKVVSIYSTTDCFFTVGSATVGSNSHFLPSGTPQDIVVGDKNERATCIVLGSATTAGTAYISERF